MITLESCYVKVTIIFTDITLQNMTDAPDTKLKLFLNHFNLTAPQFTLPALCCSKDDTHILLYAMMLHTVSVPD